MAVEVELQKDGPNSTEVLTIPIFRTKQIAILQAHEISQALLDAFPGLLRRLENFTNEGSGWVVSRMTKLWLNVARYQPLSSPTLSSQEQEGNNEREKQ